MADESLVYYRVAIVGDQATYALHCYPDLGDGGFTAEGSFVAPIGHGGDVKVTVTRYVPEPISRTPVDPNMFPALIDPYKAQVRCENDDNVGVAWDLMASINEGSVTRPVALCVGCLVKRAGSL